MRKLISMIFTLTIILAAQSVWAQEKEKNDARSERRTMIEELAEMKKAQTSAANAQPTLNVGDAESFGKNVKFLGNASTGAVYVYHSCDPAVLLADLELTLEPEDRCVAHTGGATTAAVFDDLGSITLPGKSADNLIYYFINSTIANNYENFTPVPLFTSFTYAPRLTIESVALNDPAAVDPSTGLPLNGVLTLTVNAGRLETRTIQPNASESYVENPTRAASRGLSRSVFADLGLPPQVIDKLYRQPMTIRFGMRVTVRNVFFGQYFYSVRLMGN